MRKNADAGGTKIVSIHPFSSNLENNCIFGEYQRRYDDFIGMYQNIFTPRLCSVQTLPLSTARLPSKSDRSPRNIILSVLPLLLMWAGARVSESVRKMLSISAHRISTFKANEKYLGDDFHLVFDIKQSIRSGYNPFDFLTK